jgi:hypothetical protein
MAKGTITRAFVPLSAALLLAACASNPMPAPSPTPVPSETGLDPNFTESPPPLSDGEIPDDLQGRRLVAVVITYAAWSSATQEILVGGFVPDVVENGGVCELRASSGDVNLTTQRMAEADASGTSCGQLALKSPELVGGDWSILIAYSSPSSAGQSAAQQLDIP